MSSRSDDAADQPPSVVNRSALDKTPIAPGSENFVSEIRFGVNPANSATGVHMTTLLVERTGAVVHSGRLIFTHIFYGEFCIRRQRDDNDVTQLFCGRQMRLGPRPTLRRRSLGLETTGELKT